MWISNRVADWVSDLKKDADQTADVAKQAFSELREDLAAVRAERDALKNQLATLQTNFDWLRLQWNQMQFENKALLERAYGVRVPTPELARKADQSQFNLQDLFNDVGDETAHTLGLPLYGKDN